MARWAIFEAQAARKQRKFRKRAFMFARQERGRVFEPAEHFERVWEHGVARAIVVMIEKRRI